MLLLNVLLALAWVVLTGQFTVLNTAAGFGLGYVALLLGRRADATRYGAKIWQVVSFAAYFLCELVVANVRVLASVLGPRDRLRPAIVAVPLDVRSDVEITLLANLITLTPGTLSLDVSVDRSVLFVHVIHVDDVDAFIREVKGGFERRIREVFA